MSRCDRDRVLGGVAGLGQHRGELDEPVHRFADAVRGDQPADFVDQGDVVVTSAQSIPQNTFLACPSSTSTSAVSGQVRDLADARRPNDETLRSALR